jgi:DNA-binding beta-propeller fold protein YncE
LNSASSKIIVGKQADGTYFVPTGQTLAPAGKNLPFEGRPVDLAMRPDGKVLAVMLGSEIKFLDTATGEFKPNDLRGSHSFGGIVWARDGRTLYTTTNDGVAVTRFDASDQPEKLKPIEIDLNSRIKPNRSAKSAKPCGLALSPDEKTLYAPLFNNGTLAVIDLSSYKPDTGEAKVVEVPVGSSPERVVVSPAGDKIYVANRGGKAPEDGDTVDKSDPVVVDPDTYKASTGTLSVISTVKIATDPEHAVTKNINVGLQPTDLALSSNGSVLYAANANADSISVIRTSDDSVVETIPTSPAPGRLAESSPNGLAAAPDGRTLYVSLGGDNAIEVVSLGAAAGGAGAQSRIAGLIPTAWFPIGVALSKDATSLYVINSKGIGSLGPIVKKSRASSDAMTPEEGPGGTVIGGNFVGHSVYAVMGSVGIIQVPDATALRQYTSAVGKNNDFTQMDRAIKQPRDPFWERFKHVILVIKENRTYDQILGDIDLPAGHVGGDPKLVMFGEKVTPNQHAIAREFGLFDNIYCSGAISADGHHWLNEAFASDYSERAMNNYPRSYPCCGSDPLVFAGNPFLWEAALKAGRTFYNYGEFGPLPSIQRHSDNDYSSQFEVTRDRNRDVAHCERILSDIQKPEKGLAQFTTIWFGNNHTSGTSPGAFTPEACVADNDLAVGMLVEGVTHSKKYWEEEPTAIFIIEDDAQGGLDHVEGHRTTGFVVSPFNKRHQIVSTNMNQLNMVRTIELMLDLKPLNQFDAASSSMRSLFQEKADLKPFDLVKNKIALNLKNPPRQRVSGKARHWAEVSATLDFSEPDRADPEKLTEILWHHTHGDAAYPPADAAR